jgi:hypothetical protein
MAKRVDPLKAKQAKQKKIAIGGAVLLLGLLGLQGPKTLKMLQGPPQATASEAAAAPTPVPVPAPATAPGSAPGTAPAPQSVPADLASVADSDGAPSAEQGQLASFERFASKDPFAQQARPAAPAAAAPAPAGGGGATGGQAGGGQAASGQGDQPSGGASAPAAPSSEPAPSPGGGFTVGGSGSGSGASAPAAPTIAATTSIAVNGVAEDVAPEVAFPKEEPTFVLVSVAENGKSVEIGIAGGQYADGGATMTLTLGKPLTLQNTVDGSRYELVLRSVAGFPLPKR